MTLSSYGFIFTALFIVSFFCNFVCSIGEECQLSKSGKQEFTAT